MKRIRANVAYLILLVPVPLAPSLSAQDPAREARAGDRVRIVTADSPTPVVGDITDWGEATIDVRDRAGALHSLTLDRVETIERSLGGRRHAGSGFLIGAAVGGLVGAVLGGGLGSDASLAFAGVGIVGVGLTGALVGSLVHTERWALVPFGTRGNVGLAFKYDGLPEGRGLTIGLAFSPP